MLSVDFFKKKKMKNKMYQKGIQTFNSQMNTRTRGYLTEFIHFKIIKRILQFNLLKYVANYLKIDYTVLSILIFVIL